MPKKGEKRPGVGGGLGNGQRRRDSEARRERVMKAWHAGEKDHVIAEREGVTRNMIGYIRRRFCYELEKMDALPLDHASWLAAEALKNRVSITEMARIILIDAITEELDKRHGQATQYNARLGNLEHGVERGDPVDRGSKV